MNRTIYGDYVALALSGGGGAWHIQGHGAPDVALCGKVLPGDLHTMHLHVSLLECSRCMELGAPKPDDLGWASRFPDHCEVGVVREGEDTPCMKPAIGVIRPADWEYEEFGEVSPYAVCVHHARKDRMVPLRTLLEWPANAGVR